MVEVLTRLLEEAGFVDVEVEGSVFKTLTLKSPSEFYSPPTAAMLAKINTNMS